MADTHWSTKRTESFARCPYPRLDCANKLEQCLCKAVTSTDFGEKMCPFYINREFNEARAKKHDCLRDYVEGEVDRKYKRYLQEARELGNTRLADKLFAAAVNFSITMDRIFEKEANNGKQRQ